MTAREPRAPIALYDGQLHVADLIERAPGSVEARRPNGKLIGTYSNMTDARAAVRAISKASERLAQ